jgi:maleamate amidohydrolase
MNKEVETYTRQGFGADLDIKAPLGLLIVDFVNGFADPNVFGGGNIAAAIRQTVKLLTFARKEKWPICHSRIVFASDSADRNIFSIKVPGLLRLTEDSWDSAIVPELTPCPGELVVRKCVPSAFFGTSLGPWLTQHGVQTLIVAGATTSGCVRASVVDGVSFGFRPLVLSDCVGDRAMGPHEANLFDMEQKYATVMTLDQALLAIEVASPSLSLV